MGQEQFKREIIQHSESTDYEDALLEFKVKRFERVMEPNNCICGHDIVENCFVENIYNGNVLTIGNCCIKKFFPAEEVEEAQRLRREAINLTRVCKLDNKRYRKEGCLNDEVCNSCHLMNKKCETCKEYFHCEDEEMRRYKKMCTPCWQQSKGYKVTTTRSTRTSTRRTRDCIIAGCRCRIKIEEPDWKVYCKKHYKQRKGYSY